MTEFIKELGINVGISIAGLFGSLLMIGKKSAQNLRTTIFSMISGVACANYLTPVILSITSLDMKYQFSVAFVLGFLGLKSVEIVAAKILNIKHNNGNGNINNN